VLAVGIKRGLRAHCWKITRIVLLTAGLSDENNLPFRKTSARDSVRIHRPWRLGSGLASDTGSRAGRSALKA
jgi:hypothetical protein